MRLSPLLLIATAAAAATTNPADSSASISSTSTKLFQSLRKVISSSIFGTASTPATDTYLLSDGDAHVTRLTDSNYGEVVESGREEDVWVILVHVPPRESVGFRFMETHSNASLLAYSLAHPALLGTNSAESDGMEHGFDENAGKENVKTDTDADVKTNVKWARVDYMAEVSTCTRWLLFRPPTIVIATNQGRTLRFLSQSQVPLNGSTLYTLMTLNETLTGSVKEWEQVPVWKSYFGPGGDGVWWIDLYLNFGERMGGLTGKIPKWVWLLASGAFANQLLAWMHRKPASAVASQ